MSDSNVQTLEKISSEVVESQFKIVLSIQCIKAQGFLVDKLRKQSEQSKQICNIISNGNFKLENDIRLGKLEVQSLLSATETIKSANVELKKELLLLKDEKNDLTERVESGIKKYEKIWLKSKKQYDNIPIIKKKLQAQNKEITLENDISTIDLEIQNLIKALDTKKKDLIDLDKKYIINVAEFMTHERPQLLQYVKDKKEEIDNLKREINDLENEREDNNRKPSKLGTLEKVLAPKKNESSYVMENFWSDISKNNNNKNNETVLIPKLQLQNIDLDILTDKLDQIKRGDSINESSIKRADYISAQKKYLDNNNSFQSLNIKTSINEYKNKDTYQTINYSEKKLIHILEDIKLHKKETFNIFSKLNPNEFHDVTAIKTEFDLNKIPKSQKKIADLVETDQNEVVEEVDLTENNSSNIIVPPTQFLDLSQCGLVKYSQKWGEVVEEISLEKKVSLDAVPVEDDTNNINKSQEEITSSQLNTCSGNDNSYKKIKEKVFKEHNLELSPQFTYSKNTMVQKVYEIPVTSKFFDVRDNTKNIPEPMDMYRQTLDPEVKVPSENLNTKQDSSVASCMFSRDSKGSPELDILINSTSIEDSNEFPHSIDSTLLLSPKADLEKPISGDKNSEVLSQEIPNFLSGLRKVGFSFFGNSSSEKKTDSNNENLNTDFNFNFGSTEKKNRGGLFNMFD